MKVFKICLLESPYEKKFLVISVVSCKSVIKNEKNAFLPFFNIYSNFKNMRV